MELLECDTKDFEIPADSIHLTWTYRYIAILNTNVGMVYKMSPIAPIAERRRTTAPVKFLAFFSSTHHIAIQSTDKEGATSLQTNELIRH